MKAADAKPEEPSVPVVIMQSSGLTCFNGNALVSPTSSTLSATVA